MKTEKDIEQQKKKQPIVQINNLTKIFRDFWRRPKVRAVNNLSLNIYQGEIFGLLGPNGSGKSTTIKILLGLLHPSSGNVTVLNCRPHEVATKSEIGYLPEESHLYKHLTARESLDFYGRLFDIKKADRLKRIDELLDMVGLTHAADRQIGEFSKGMARRIGLAQALINDPKLIILDEPTSGLDPIGCRQVKDLIIALSERGKTILLSSHLLADVEDVCDQVTILFNGSIRASGSIKQLLETRDRTRLTIPSLSTDKLKKVLDTVRKEVGSEPEIDHPSLNLEQFFLQVVAKANKIEAKNMSGATSDTKIASFLQDAN
jgi:ABC-2 type transport system ATP-binding protein